MSPLLRKSDCGGDTSTCGLTTLCTRNLSPRWTWTTGASLSFFLSPSSRTRETRNARDWRREMKEARNMRDTFFFSRCYPRFLRLCRGFSARRTPLTKSVEKERLLTVQGGQKAWLLPVRLYKALNVFILKSMDTDKSRVFDPLPYRPFQTSNFACAESNMNEREQYIFLFTSVVALNSADMKFTA